MSLTTPSLGYTQSLGIQYTAVADTMVDFSSASNDTYIYNLEDKLVYYKDTQGEIIHIFKSSTPSTTSSTTIHFSSSTIYGTNTTPLSTGLSENLTGSLLGIVQKIYHQSSSLSVPAGWVQLGSNSYASGSLNIVYAEWSSGSRVEYWLIQ